MRQKKATEPTPPTKLSPRSFGIVLIPIENIKPSATNPLA